MRQLLEAVVDAVPVLGVGVEMVGLAEMGVVVVGALLKHCHTLGGSDFQC